MDIGLFLLTYGGVQLLATVSPGPAFAVVTQKALSSGKRGGLGAACGTTAGVFIWLSMTMLGLEFVVSQIWWLYTALKIAGGIFLIYLAIQLWRHADEPLPEIAAELGRERSFWSSFRAGLLVQLSNPKALAFCTSVLVTLLPAERPVWMMIAVPALGTLIEALWWSFLALTFSRGGFRSRYSAFKRSIDRAVGAALGVLGVKLLADQP
jgi:threonine/homoserine/homoserine lactone efflux protein